MTQHQLIGAPVSLYTGKLRAYLRFKRIPFDEVLATREVFQQVIVPRTGVRFIPVLISDDDVAVQDTTEIIDFLEARYPEPSVYPSSPAQKLVALLLEVYGDEWLVLPAMHYRWSFEENRAFAIGEFGKTSAPDATPEQQRAIGEQLSGPFAGALPYLGVTAESAPAIERSYEALLAELDAHFASHPFLLGTRPSIGDYGLLGPLYAHLHRDPYSGRLMHRLAPRVADWVERMNAPGNDPGSFLPDDQVPGTLLPILQRMFREQGPVLRNTESRLVDWARDHEAGDEVPRSLGMHSFQLEGVTERRSVAPYALWMWQRAHDHLAALDDAPRAQALEALAGVEGAREALSKSLPARVRRVNNRLVLSG